MSDPVVSVRGEAVLEVAPEVAELNVAVGARDKHREDTLRRLDERSTAVLALVESFGDAVEDVRTNAVRIGPEFKDGKPNERVTSYSAGVRHTVTVVDFTRLGDLVVRLAEIDLVDVAGPWWRLRPDSPAYRDARIAAVREAVSRARQYAEALGTRVTGLLALADTGLLGEHQPESGQFPIAPAAMAARGTAYVAERVVLDLEPSRQVVHASVEARFVVAPPPAESL